MDHEKVLGEHKFPTYEELKTGLIRLIDEGKISREDAARLLPELGESEDERIRKAVVSLVYEMKGTYQSFAKVELDKMVAWLEEQKEQKPVDYDHEMWKNCEANFEGGKKEVIDHPEKYGLQKEQKPAEWSDTKELVFKDICNHLEVEGYDGWVVLLNALRNGEFQQKSAEWSEEDAKMLDAMIDIVSGSFYEPLCPRKEMLAWLKSLRPSWKPSEKQMNCLCAAVDAAIRKHNESVGGYEPARVLKSLYEDLKKL